MQICVTQTSVTKGKTTTTTKVLGIDTVTVITQ
jgi:hypothetical protein